MTKDRLDLLERELVDRAGPLGKFVLVKQLKDMGFTAEDFPEAQFPLLIDGVVKKAFFNQDLWPQMIGELKRKVLA